MTSRITRSTTKTDGRDPVTGFIKVLSDPTRLGILELLLDHGELCVCELTAALCVSQPKASRHLGLLRKRHLILNRRRGTWIYYRLSPKLARWQKEVLQACRGHSAIARWHSPLPAHSRDSCTVGKGAAHT
ncbi:MAG: metalloregulator ArsR/SmtB family transcription factor [Gammaproteobacteria bacterium]